MSELRGPRGSEWEEVGNVLRWFTNVMAVRAQYPEGHPAIVRADQHAVGAFDALLAKVPELIVAMKEGEFIVCDRPMPELKQKLATLASAMGRHNIECVVFQRGVTLGECASLGRMLLLGSGAKVRELGVSELSHILFRFAEVRAHDRAQGTGVL